MSQEHPEFPIEVFEVLTSTNDSILAAGEDGHPQGITHVALSQTRGRGRGGHSWWSPAGAGLWMSTLLRPTRARPVWSGIALLAGAAARDALGSLGTRGVELYWPNDLQVGAKKVGGILCEVRELGGKAWVALGVGINIDFRRSRSGEEMPQEIRGQATSMIECGAPATTDPVRVARAILAYFWPLFRRFEGGEDVGSIVGPSLAHVGRRVRIEARSRPPWHGTVEGLGPCGELLVRAEQPAGGFDPAPPGGSWLAGSPGIAAVTGGEVRYEG